MNKTMKSLGLAISAAGLLMAPSVAFAHPDTHHHRHHYHHGAYQTNDRGPERRNCRGSANTGALVGAVGGGLVGHAVSNDGLAGTLVGAGLGGLTGHQIAKVNCKHR